MHKGFFVLALLLLFPIYLSAQAPPRAETQAAVLQDLSQRVGQSLSLGSFSSQQWFFGTYDFVRDLGCLGSPATAPVGGGWQRFEYVLQNTTYVYLISDDASSLILCNEASLPTPLPSTTSFIPPIATANIVIETSIPPATATAVLPQATPTIQAIVATPETCNLVPRLEVGSIAQVTPGDPNWVHRQPSRSTEKIGEIPGNAQFTVLDGPRCDLSSRMNYWQVDYNGLIGWTSEGLDGQYWLQPAISVADDLIDYVRQAQSPAWLDAVSSDTLVELSPGGLLVALGDSSGMVNLWFASTGEFIRGIDRQSPITAIRFHSSDSIIVIGSADGRVMVERDVLGVDLPIVEFVHDSSVTALALSNDRSLVVVGDAAGKITFWNLAVEDTTTPALTLQLSEPAGEIEIKGTTVLIRTFNGDVLAAFRIPAPSGG